MVTENYTTRTAALKAAVIDTRILDARQITLKGKDITEMMGLNLPEDYPKLVTRCELPEDEYWSLFDDNGNLLYMNFSDKIINGDKMFAYKNISSFSLDLPSLANGYYMFGYCKGLTTFTSDMSSLTDGYSMFEDCKNLTTFTSDLSSVTNGNSMFYYCTALTDFNSNLTNLTNGSYMFRYCKLNYASLSNIANTIKDVNGLQSGSDMNGDVYTCIDITYGEVTAAEATSVKLALEEKGWRVNMESYN